MEVSLDQYESLVNGTAHRKLIKSVQSNIRNAIINRAVFFLYKGKFVPDSRSHIGLSQAISIDKKEFRLEAEKA
jgi:hypothetical protein